MQVCVGNKMYAFLLREREYYDEQLPLNDRLCPAAVINHAHCPLQPPSSTHQRAQAAAQAGRYKQDPGTTNPPHQHLQSFAHHARPSSARVKERQDKRDPDVMPARLKLCYSQSHYLPMCLPFMW